MHDAATMDHGVDGTKLSANFGVLNQPTVAGVAQAFVAVATNLVANVVGPWRDIAGADIKGEYGVIIPRLQTDGVTATTANTLLVTLDFCDDTAGKMTDATGTVADTITKTLTNISSTANGGLEAFLPFSTGHRYVRATLTWNAGNLGNVVAGLVFGQPRRLIIG